MSAPKITISETQNTWVVRVAGAVLGESQNALRLVEGDLPAVTYFPREDIAMDFFDASDLKTTSPDKGEATYFSVVAKSSTIENAVWTYENPLPAAAEIKGMLAFDTTKTTVEMV